MSAALMLQAITYLNVGPETFVKLWELGERLLKEMEWCYKP